MKHPHATPDLFGLTWPIFVEQLLMVSIGTLGLWLAGHVSTAAVAVFGLSNQLRSIFDRIFRVVGIGTSVVLTQHRGAGDEAGARDIARAGLAASTWTGLAAMALVGLMPSMALRILHLPTDLFSLAIPFFILTGIGLVLDSVFITMGSVLRAFTLTKHAMRLTMTMNILQVVISFPLVFGFAGIPAQGLMGLGWGHILSRVLVIGLLALTWVRRLGIPLPLSLFVHRHRHALPAILNIGLPSAGEKIGFRIAYLMTVSMAASMGAEALASHAYCTQAASWITMYMVSLGFGAEIVAGHLVGAGKLREAHVMIWRALWVAMGITMAGAVIGCFVTPAAIGWITKDPHLVSLIGTIMILELLLEPGRCLNVVLMGGLRAAGDVRFPVKFSVISNFVFCAGVGWIAGVHFGLGLAGIWIGYTADEWARGLIMLWRWSRLGWTTTARTARRRILQRIAAR